VTDLVLALPILLFSVVAHEYAHAWTAYRQGDDTAHALGRLTLNPLPHIDPVMSVLVPIGLFLMTKGAFTFGAAKPVPVDPRKFREYVKGDLIVSSAGIVTNLGLGVASAGLLALVVFLGGIAPSRSGVLSTLQTMLQYGVFINFTLAIFNLVPIPPLDGSHLFYHLLPPAWGARYRRLGRFGFVLILALSFVDGFWTVVLWPVNVLYDGALTLVRDVALPTVVR
jgi:Zn-dependent protease